MTIADHLVEETGRVVAGIDYKVQIGDKHIQGALHMARAIVAAIYGPPCETPRYIAYRIAGYPESLIEVAADASKPWDQCECGWPRSMHSITEGR